MAITAHTIRHRIDGDVHVHVAATGGDALALVRECEAAAAEAYMDGPTCSLCDGLGHGYPGAGPCPLEMTGWAEAELQDRMEALAGVR
jgi:hypothetical protein